MLAATAKDANDSLFPLAYAVVDTENDNNWLWFNQHLRTVIVQHASAFLIPRGLTFVSDRQKGLLESIERMFPESSHSYCVRHLYENMYKQYKHPALKTFLFTATEATTEADFNKALDGIKGISANALNWLLNHAHPQYWTDLYFSGKRYGHTTSNIAESLNATILEAQEKPIIGMFESIRHQLMRWFKEGRQIDSNNLPAGQIVVSKASKRIRDLAAWQARRYRLIPSSETEFEVFSLEKSVTYTVNLDFMACTCFQWQSSGIPCSHAIAVILGRKEDPQTYCQKFFFLDAYRNSYANAIYAPNADENELRTFTDGGEDCSNLSGKQQIIPPHAHRPPGRPQKRRIRSGVEGPFGKKRQKKCLRCGGYSHAVTTCDAAI